MTILLSGREPAEKIKNFVKEGIGALGYAPKLAAVQIGESEASLRYFSGQKKACETVGAKAEYYNFPANIEKEKFIEEFKRIANAPEIDGIILMTPLPKGWNANEFLPLLPAEKDVEGVHPENLGRLYMGETDIPLPCTANAAVALLEYYGRKSFEGKLCAILGRSPNVGRAAALLMLHRQATVAVCHTKTDKAALENLLKNADIVISAAGKAGIINANTLKRSTWAVDVGTNFKEGRLVGDIEYKDGDIEAISPVPGGVGPLTVALLLANLLFVSAKRRTGRGIKFAF